MNSVQKANETLVVSWREYLFRAVLKIWVPMQNFYFAP